jgi:trk system potassium uptake protein TrkH
MNKTLSRLPFILEIILNGLFVLHFSLERLGKWPAYLENSLFDLLFNNILIIAPVIVGLSLLTHIKQSYDLDDFFRKYIFSMIIFVSMIITWADIEFCYWLSVVHLFSTILTLTDHTSDEKKPISVLNEQWIWNLKALLKLQPAQIVILSFGLIILIGTVLLMLPISAPAGKAISWVDALFMSTSATCVTGLASISMVDDLSLFGQLVILGLIQVGGLGIMTLSSSLIMFLGRSLGVKEQVVMQDVLDSSNSEELLTLIIDIVKFTLFIETIGAIILTYGFIKEGFETGQALYLGFYHSISAFCNAGLALFNNNLEDFYGSPWINLPIAFLIIFGGLGFSVIKELNQLIAKKKKIINLTVHSKVVLSMTLMLIALGTIYIFFGEFLHATETMSLSEKIQVAFFQSVTTRTAGFNTINLNNFHAHTIYLIILLMAIGASPGSTGGGVKTTTFAILLQSVKATLNNQNKVVLFNRTVPDITVVRAISLFIISLMFVSFVVLVMLRVETGKEFLPIFFEVVSAFGTVGLSLGITPLLSVAGKIIIVFMMFLGRVGPLTLVLAVGQRAEQKGRVDYPDGKILIG